MSYQDDIFELVHEIPLQDIIRRYTPTEPVIKAGRMWLLCPFHSEKTPSLSIKGEKWHCFGCQKGGDGVDFVARLCGLSIIEAARMICQDFGLIVDMGKPLTPEQRKEIQTRREQRQLGQLWEQGKDTVFRMAADMRDALLTVTTPEDADPEILETVVQLENLIDVLMYGNFEDIMHVLNGGWYYGYSG